MAIAKGEDKRAGTAMATRILGASRAGLVRLLDAERRRLPLWLPVCAGLGIQVHFLLPAEPSGWLVAATLALPAALLPWAALRGLGRAHWLWLALAVASAGFAAASVRAHLVAAPRLESRIDATVEGRVAEVSRSRSGRRRVELTDPVIYGLAAAATPERLRVTLLGGDFAREVRVGERLAVFSRLGPPGGPVEPGGFDFRRLAWFEGLGAIGYARGPAVAASGAGPPETLAERVGRWRGALTDGILASLPRREGGFAAAILTGSRAEVGAEDVQALRDSNLAHLLAISGLHMGLLVGLVFGAARLGLALFPGVASRLPAKKLAAAAALAAAAGYLALSGASVATQRAFVMAAAALIAVMLDRPAISLRALAAAALAILFWRPESLLDAGFQMSFAATVALVAVYERVGGLSPGEGVAKRVLIWLAALTATSIVAGLATAPFAAANFHRATAWGLPANLLAVPVMGFWVMPAGALAAAAAPLGLEGAPLRAMGEGIRLILGIAEWAAGLPGAVRGVPAAPAGAVALVTLGGLWAALWRTRLRVAGLAAAAGGLALWAGVGTAARPELLVAPRGALVGVMGPEGRALDRERGAGYAAGTWLERDGDLATQAEAAERRGLARGEERTVAVLSNGWRVEVLRGPASPARVAARCAARTVVVAWGARAPFAEAGPCVALDRAALAVLGALSVEAEGEEVRIRGARTAASERLWGGGREDEDGF